MIDREVRSAARRRVAAGASTVRTANELGVSQAAVWRWTRRQLISDTSQPTPCWRCRPEPPNPKALAAYAYLLGQYLGDGHLVTSARVPVLRIYSCTDHPTIVDEVGVAIAAVRGRAPGLVVPAHTDRMVSVQSYWMHWPCVLPQHGPGRKHERPILLTDWQDDIVAAHPWELIRGLIHSDGCRSMNTVTVRGRRYSYPRYFFANESRDILAIMGDTLDTVGVRWRFNRPNSISIARRDSVALMEEHVGPKR